MPAASFEFDENEDLSKNLDAFADHLEVLDAELGGCLREMLPAFVESGTDNAVVLDALFALTAPSQPAIGGSSKGGKAVATGAVAAASTGVTGWLLEGLSIEGFRGINNEGKPLELKFVPDKVNSVSAVNGVGKSSVHDAVRYAISGKLQWLDDLPATEKAGDYYLNRFHSAGLAEIKLRLVAEPSGKKCEVTIKRDKSGARKVSASAGWDGQEVLRTLDREFVLLDGPTFNRFIAAKPLERGRTFSGLLGLSAYSQIRQALSALSHTKSYSNHFNLTGHAQTRAKEEKNISDGQAAIAKDYAILVGEGFDAGGAHAVAQAKCHAALAQIGPLKPACEGKAFLQIDIDECLEAVKLAEGGPKRERLRECVAERAEIATLGTNAPADDRAKKLVELASTRSEALEKTSGDVLLELFQVGAKVLNLPSWADPSLCPLCETGTPHDLRSHLNQKLTEFEALDESTRALALEWEEGGWSDLLPFEKILESTVSLRLAAQHEDKGLGGVLSPDDAAALVAWHKTLRGRAVQREKALKDEQLQLEYELPQSSVEVTKKIEAARRLQTTWVALAESERAVDDENARADRVSRTKTFLDSASVEFGKAETALSRARLAAVEPLFKDYFKKMAFMGVIPAVSKRANSEDLQIFLADFYGQKDLSPQALLSESFRNAFAVSLYLAAASLYGGLPRFIILDDVTSSFDAGHQNFLAELLRTTFARPGNASGPQVILLSHDTMLEKLFNKHTNSGGWFHQRLEGSPQLAVFPQAGAVNKVRDQTISQLQAGQVDSAKEGVRQYLEYRLNDLIAKLRIPVPVDVAFNDNKHLAGEFLSAIDSAVKLYQAAGSLILEPAQVVGLNANMATIVGNFLSHWGTGQTLSFSGPALLGVMQAIDDYCDCFTYEPAPGTPRVYYKALSQK